MVSKRLIAGLFAGLLPISSAVAQEILKREPAAGTLRYGAKVLVDNGKCPRGQVQEITGGRMPSRGTRLANATSTPREKRCVPRP